MPNDELESSFKGQKFKVVHCVDALDTLKAAMDSVAPNKRASFKRGLSQQIQRLADGHRMSKESFPQEGNLPKQSSQSKAKKFNAFKRIPIRGYCWLSEKHTNTYFISHYVYKDYQKLKDADVDIVGKNWIRIEVEGDER